MSAIDSNPTQSKIDGPAGLYPTKEDVSKIHAEANLFIAQRWTLVTASLSIVGAVLAWITQKVSTSEPTTIPLLFVGTSLLLCFLTVIGFMETTLEVNQSFLAAFLRLTASSNWEVAVQRFRGQHKRGIYRTSGKRLTLMALGLLVLLWPLILLFALGVREKLSPYLVLHMTCAAGLFLFLLVFFPAIVQYESRRNEKIWANILGV